MLAQSVMAYNYSYNNYGNYYNRGSSVTYTGIALGLQADGTYGMIPVS